MSLVESCVQSFKKINKGKYSKEKEELKNLIWPILQVAAFVFLLLVSIVIPSGQSIDLKPYRIAILILILFFIVMNVISLFNIKVKRRVVYKAKFYFALGLILILWDILTCKLNLLPLPFFPSMGQIVQSVVEDRKILALSTVYSLRLLSIGFVIGVTVGLISGVLIGWYKKWHYWLFPIIKAIGIIPATAWIPVAMFIFPKSFYAEVFLIVLCVWFPVAFMTCSGIKNIQKSYFEAGKTLGADEKFLIFKIAIPGAMPSIFSGIYTGISVAFATLIVSEILGAKAGLGWYIDWAKGWSNYAKVYASLIIMGVVFSIVMVVIFKVRNRLLRWQRGLLK